MASAVASFLSSVDPWKREVLSELAEQLAGCNHQHFDTQTALDAACLLSTMVSKRKSPLAWTCLWRLCDVEVNTAASEFLERFETRRECAVILARCISCLSHTTHIQRVTCFKFLVAFMQESPFRTRAVCDVPDLPKCLLMVAQTEFNNAPPDEFYYSVVAICHLSQSHCDVYEEEDCQVGEKYCEIFMEAGGLKAMTRVFHTLPSDHGWENDNPGRSEVYFDSCISAMRSLWTFLTSPWGARLRQVNSKCCVYPDGELPYIARTLHDLITTVADKAQQKMVLAAALAFFLYVAIHKGDQKLADCLDFRARFDRNEQNLLLAFARGIVSDGTEANSRGIDYFFALWRRDYPLVGAVLDMYCPTPLWTEALQSGMIGAAMADAVDKTSPVAAEQSAEAVELALSTMRLSALQAGAGGCDAPPVVCIGRNRHCAYPDCAITGTGTKYTWKCARCRAVYYCSQDHQAQHWWAAHRAMCKKALVAGPVVAL